MGVTTLLYLVPVPLAAAHQAGSVLLLTTMLGLAGTMRRPSALARAYKAARQSSMQAQGSANVKAGQQAGFAGNVQGVLRNVDSSLKARVNTP
jgi:starvation-inducible outer membrane lipoprotein